MHARALPRSACRGFTLIELSLVVVILGIALTLVIVSVDWMVPEQRIKSAATGIGGLLQLARSEAAMHGTSFGIVYDLDKHRYWLRVPTSKTGIYTEEYDPDSDTGADGRQTLYYTEFPDEVRFKDVQLGEGVTKTAGKVQIEITALGTASGHLVHLYNTKTNQQYTVELNALTALVTYHDKYVKFEEVTDYEE